MVPCHTWTIDLLGIRDKLVFLIFFGFTPLMTVIYLIFDIILDLYDGV